MKMPTKMAAKVRRIALGRLERTFNIYARTDVDESPFSGDSATIIATQGIWRIAIDTLAGRMSRLQTRLHSLRRPTD